MKKLQQVMNNQPVNEDYIQVTSFNGKFFGTISLEVILVHNFKISNQMTTYWDNWGSIELAKRNEKQHFTNLRIAPSPNICLFTLSMWSCHILAILRAIIFDS